MRSARELVEHREAMAVAALAGLAPAACTPCSSWRRARYYPLFVASCWLCWRVLVRGRWRDAAACAVALGLTYFAKPLAVPLVAAYAGVVLLWARRSSASAHGDARDARRALALRLAPVAAFGAMLVVRHALTARGADATQSGVVLGRFYTDELGGALLPPIRPFAARGALARAGARARASGSRRSWRCSAAGASARRRPAAALARRARDRRGGGVRARRGASHDGRSTAIPKIHERYVFAVGPLFLALFFVRAAPLGVGADRRREHRRSPRVMARIAVHRRCRTTRG